MPSNIATTARIANAGAWGARSAWATAAGLYVVTQNTSTGKLSVWNSSDGTTWTEQDSADAPINFSTTHPFSTWLHTDGYIYLVYFTATTTLRCRRFDTATNQWETTDIAGANISTNAQNAVNVRVVVRGDGDVLAIYNSGSAALSVARYEGSSWSVGASISTSAHWVNDVVIDGNDRAWFLYVDNTNNDSTYRSYDSANAFGTETDLDSTAHTTAKIRASIAALFNDGTNNKLAQLIRDTTGDFDIHHGNVGAATLASTGFINAVTTTTTPQTTSAALVAFNSKLYAVWAVANGIQYDSSTSLTTLTFGTDVNLLTGLTDADPCPQWITGGGGLGVVYQDGGTVKVEWITAPSFVVTKSASDGSEIGTTDAASLDAGVTSADSTELGATEAASTLASLTVPADGSQLGTTDSAEFVETADKSVSDGSALGTSDAASRLETVAKSADDGAAIGTTEVVETEKRPTVADSTALDATEAVTTERRPTVADTTQIGTTDAATKLETVDKIAADGSVLGTTDAATILESIAKATDDSTTLGTTDATSLSATATLADSAALGSTDAASASATATIADSSSLGTTDAATKAETANKSASDGSTLGTTDSATKLETIAKAPAPDGSQLGTAETGVVSATATVADSTPLGASDAAAVLATTTRADSSVLGTTDAASKLETALKTPTDSTALGAIESASTTASAALVDTTPLGTAEAVSVAVYVILPDSTALGSVETWQVHNLTDIPTPAKTFVARRRSFAYDASERSLVFTARPRRFVYDAR